MAMRRGVSGLITVHENAALITAGINTGVHGRISDATANRKAHKTTNAELNGCRHLCHCFLDVAGGAC